MIALERSDLINPTAAALRLPNNRQQLVVLFYSINLLNDVASEAGCALSRSKVCKRSQCHNSIQELQIWGSCEGSSRLVSSSCLADILYSVHGSGARSAGGFGVVIYSLSDELLNTVRKCAC